MIIAVMLDEELKPGGSALGHIITSGEVVTVHGISDEMIAAQTKVICVPSRGQGLVCNGTLPWLVTHREVRDAGQA